MSWGDFLSTLGWLVGATLLVCAGIVALVTMSGSRRHRLYQAGGMDLLDESSPAGFAAFVAAWKSAAGCEVTACENSPAGAHAFIVSQNGTRYLLAVRRERAAIKLEEIQALARHAGELGLPLRFLTNSSLYPDAGKWARGNGVKVTEREALIRQLGESGARALAAKFAGNPQASGPA